jgi:hypothetical protein
MNLETLLPELRSLDHLSRLVAALGHQPLWELIPGESRGGTAPADPTVAVVGRTGDLPWFAIESHNPDRAAEKLARRMERRGRVCLVFALDPTGRRLALAAAMNGCPCLDLSLVAPSPQALSSLRKLVATSESGVLSFAFRAADALSAQSVGRRFFREFRTTLECLSEGLPHAMPDQDRHNLALLHLTRVLFLYFIQTKGWLAGRHRFIAEEVDRCLGRGRRIHRDLLRPLFFGTLNCPPDLRSRTAAAFGSIPFLNGGLFEPHALERRFPSDIRNDLWREAFDRLFERFHFTVTEGDSGGVAPDMLGRVFEGVMAPDMRHASGSFYTPAGLVARVLDAGFTAYLAKRLRCGDTEAERRLADPDPVVAHSLASITLLDPAVGSGAFLLGGLNRLAGLSRLGKLSDRKRRVLQRNLFGVDQSAAAVRLTELRLWLAVIADDPTDQAAQVSPLPNLDCLIRQGDSLFDPIDQSGEASPYTSALATELARLRRKLINATGTTKRTLVRQLRREEASALAQSIRSAQEQNQAATADCIHTARSADLFGQPRGLDRELRERLRQLRSRGRTLRAARQQLARDGEVPWFHYQSHFADIFAKGGFDLVIGNPPWLRSEEILPSVRHRLSGRYRWWRGVARSYGNKPDLAVAFLERGLELTVAGGVLAMLVPAKLAASGYAAPARHALASSTTIHAVEDLTAEVRGEFDATVYPMAIIASKALPPPNHRVRTRLRATAGGLVKQSALAGGGPWILVRNRVREVLSTLTAAHPTVGDSFICQLGLKTGANHVFLDPPAAVEPHLLRWAVRGRDVRAFRCSPTVRLLWTHDDAGRPRARLPPASTAYLLQHERELRRRKDYVSGPPWTLYRVRAATARHRVVWSDLARGLAAATLTGDDDLQLIPLNSCYVALSRTASEAESLAASLNCTWLRVVAQLSAVPAAGGFSRFNARVVAALPFPTSAADDPLLPKLARAARLGSDVQAELDERLAGHLGLSRTAQHALRSEVGVAANHRR